MDWKGPIVSVAFAAFVLSVGFWLEPMWPLGDNRWGIAALVCAIFILLVYVTPPIWRRRKSRARPAPPEAPALVDYVTACSIANRYIDPDESMKGGKRIAVRNQILARFEQVVGAKKGDLYDAALLHQWFEKNAARALVTHQDEIV